MTSGRERPGFNSTILEDRSAIIPTQASYIYNHFECSTNGKQDNNVQSSDTSRQSWYEQGQSSSPKWKSHLQFLQIWWQQSPTSPPKIGECNYCCTFSTKTKGLNGRYKKESSHTQLWDSGRYSQDEDIYQDGSSETTSNNGSKRKPSFYYFL